MERYGFDAERHIARDKSLIVGRVVSEHRDLYKVVTEFGRNNARITGKMYFENFDEEALPAVGDFVGLDYKGKNSDSIIREILPRRSVFTRRAVGIVNQSQTLAANFDYVFIVTSMNYDFNIARLDRYVSIAWESGGIPVIILSKSDLIEDRDKIIRQISENQPGVEHHIVSSITKEGTKELKKYFTNNKTAVFLGSSGVGKSSLLNCLSGENLMEVKELRSNIEKGQHTTTHRQLFVLPDGGIVIDTPGMRELGLWHSGEGVDKNFSEIHEQLTAISMQCRFADCAHRAEPGCAVKTALKKGKLNQEQYNRYKKLQKEAHYAEMKIRSKSKIEQRERKKIIKKMIRNKHKVIW